MQPMEPKRVRPAQVVAQLSVGPEIVSGVPWTFCVSDGNQIALTLKSGNFGAETSFKTHKTNWMACDS